MGSATRSISTTKAARRNTVGSLIKIPGFYDGSDAGKGGYHIHERAYRPIGSFKDKELSVVVQINRTAFSPESSCILLLLKGSVHPHRGHKIFHIPRIHSFENLNLRGS